nr:SDR family oxidoreductase [Pseudomonas kitaguniensis]
MGRAIAAALIARGVKCVLVDIDAVRLAEAATALGPQALTYQADLTDREALGGLVNYVSSEIGRLDLLVNNAGILSNIPFETRPTVSIAREVQLNMMVPLELCQAFLPLLQQASDGRVISIVSLGGLFPMPETCIYSATKFGLRGAMLCLGLDGKRLGVKFTIVNPSATETPMLMREAIENGNKMQFMDPPQMPADVAKTVIKALEKPRLELFVRPSESWTARLAMLVPGILPHILPLFRRKSEKGHRNYVVSLEQRGLITRDGEGWRLK